MYNVRVLENRCPNMFKSDVQMFNQKKKTKQIVNQLDIELCNDLTLLILIQPVEKGNINMGP